MKEKKEKKEEVNEMQVDEPVTPTVMTPDKMTYKKVGDFEVGDPQELRPTELPLVVKPPKGGWANEAQAEFAKVVNAYAYRNPEKWNNQPDAPILVDGSIGKAAPCKKDVLLKQLADLEKNPGLIKTFRGQSFGVKFGNKLLG